MWKIIKLDKNLANQIAAGEVVERPVSIVKELVENSIDAWATQINIEILDWWIKEIKITDNGVGVEREDLPLTIEKYSTSKIKHLQDLYNIMTFGFRWEALASISSVSQFQIISKANGSHSWYALTTNWWENISIQEFPSEQGTQIIIKNLFYNTPARLHYLKKPKTEYSHILEFLHQISLSYPEVWFEFYSDGKKILKYQSHETIQTRIYNVYWEDFSQNLLEINSSILWVNISWYISNPKVSFSNKNRQSLFINHRVVKSPLIYKAISDAYNRYIPHWCHPWYVVNIDIDPTQVDVNVHPRKLEVRFAGEQNIFRNVYHCIESALNKTTLIKSNKIDEANNIENNSCQTPTFQKQEKYYTWSWTKFKSYSPYKDINYNPNQKNILESIQFTKSVLNPQDSWETKNEDTGNHWDLHYTKLWKIVWQMHNSYIIVETRNGMQVLDQHALAERIIYEKLVKWQYKAKTQWLLLWESIQLTPKQLNILEENKENFEEMWFDYEILSGNIIMINGIPDFVKKENLTHIFEWILKDIWEHNFEKSNSLQEVRNKLFAYTACRSAIKFWNKLNLFEMNKLLNDSVLDYSMTCPHWRPVIYEVDLNELKNKYER